DAVAAARAHEPVSVVPLVLPALARLPLTALGEPAACVPCQLRDVGACGAPVAPERPGRFCGDHRSLAGDLVPVGDAEPAHLDRTSLRVELVAATSVAVVDHLGDWPDRMPAPA